MSVEFLDSSILEWLEDTAEDRIDQLPFGVIGMAQDGRVTIYNKTEAEAAGLTASRVIGRNFFTSVGPCTNNYIISERFLNEDKLDTVIDYVFTLRMKPTPVQLRMLKSPTARHMYLLVRRKAHD